RPERRRQPRRGRDRGALLRACRCRRQHRRREPRRCVRLRRIGHQTLSPGRFKLLSRAGHSGFLELPWEVPLEEWESERFVNPVRGIGRHVVRFVEQEGRLYALKELPERPARREYTLLRRLEGQGMPVVEATGLVTDRPDGL